MKLMQNAIHGTSRIPLAAFAVVVLLMTFTNVAVAEEPLHVRIDRLIAETASETLAPPATDAHFLRRAYLDLAGRIPSTEVARSFLADPSGTKRQELIDRLLSEPDYARHMSELFNVLLMERLGTNSEWDAYLRASFEENKPWSQMAKEILRPVPGDDSTVGTAFFYTKRLEKYGQNPTDYPGLTRDVGRLFMGIDLQCAQCHDHLTISEYEQLDFQGLFAVYKSINIDTESEVPAIVEVPMESKLEFASVFIGEPQKTGPRIPFGREFEIPAGENGEASESPLALITDAICRADNPFFVRNIVNRLWFIMMGRGLVHPLDEHHSANPPSHPELLELLSKEFAANQFEVKFLLRELALSDTYQRTSELPDDRQAPPEDRFIVALERPLSAEQLMWSTFQAIGEIDRLADAKTLKKQRALFVTAFGNQPREPEIEFAPSVKAALFLSNDDRYLTLLDQKPGNLTDRLTDLLAKEEFADELFLSVLSRYPDEAERSVVANALADETTSKEAAVNSLVWALLTSTEFCLNQ